jgi:hypothetical protein
MRPGGRIDGIPATFLHETGTRMRGICVLPIPGLTDLSNMMQTAWATPDLDRTMAQFGEKYGIDQFYSTEIAFPARLFDETGEMHIRLALANVDAMQVELIQPIGGGLNRLYREALPVDGSHANVFHHVCVKIDGPLADWDAYFADLEKDGPVGYTGHAGPNVRFAYTDERATLGIWLEHVWYEPEFHAQMSAAIPTYKSR